MQSLRKIYYLWRILKKRTIYETVPPYNFSWFRSFTSLDFLLSKNPIYLIDVGARGGSCEELEPLQSYISYTGFDADKKESDRLNTYPPKGYKSFKTFPFYVGRKSGKQEFHLYKNLGSSSQLLPNPEFQNSFGSDLIIERTVIVDGITLDEFLKDAEQIVDILKLDTQGTELDVLKSAEKILNQALIIESEVEFIEMYQGQPLYHDVAAFLYQRGFTLLYLNRVFGNRERYKGLSRGQILFGDALFGLRKDFVQRLDWVKQFKYCVLLINYGHLDYAHDIYTSNLILQEKVPGLGAFFQKEIEANSSWWGRRKKKMIFRFEKLVYIFLSIRKTNGLTSDSDRSWPTR